MSVKNKIIDAGMGLLGSLTARQEELLAVDIRPGELYVSQLQRDGKHKQWLVEHLYQRMLSEEQVDDSHIRENVPAYASALKQIVASKKLRTKNVAVSLPVGNAIIKMVSAPLMSDEELENAIEYDSLWENLVQFAGSMDEYSIYWQVVKRDPVSSKMELLFIASKLNEINMYAEIIHAAGLQAVLMDVRCFILFDALPFHFSDDLYDKSRVGVVELGTGENYLMVAQGESVYVADIFLPSSGRDTLIQSDLSDDVIRKAMTRYAAQLRQALMLYCNKTASEPVEHLLFVSSLPLAARYVEVLNELLKDIDVRLFEPLKGLLVPEQHQYLLADEANLSHFAPVLGLAKRKLDVFGYYQYTTSAQNVNLLPSRDKVVRARKTQVSVLIGLTVLLLLGGLFLAGDMISKSWQKSQIDEQLVEHRSLTKELSVIKSQLKNISDQRRQYKPRLANLPAIKPGQQQGLQRALSDINDALPNGVWLSKISLNETLSIKISGFAFGGQAVQRFVSDLNKADHLEKFTLLNMALDQSNKEVNVFELQGGVEVPQGGDVEL